MKQLEFSLSCLHFSLMFSEGEVKTPCFLLSVLLLSSFYLNCISGVMISVLTLGAVDLGSSSGRVKPMTIKLVFVASPLSTHAAIRSKSKDWLAENQDNVSECGDMSTHRLLFQRASSIKIQLSVLEQSRHHHLNVTCFHHE